MAERLLSNPVIETFAIRDVSEHAGRTWSDRRERGLPRIGVVTFPGSLDDRDALRAVRFMGGEAVSLWHADADLRGVDAVILPGGFSYGDYLRTRRDRAVRPGHGRGSRRSPSAAAPSSGSATGSRSCARPGCCPAR